MARQFLTVAVDLVEHAERVADYFDTRGWTVKIEPNEAGYPYTPAIRCRHSHTTVFVDLHRTIPVGRIEDWTRYARSCSRDTRVAVAMPEDAPRTVTDDAKLRELRVGLYISGVNGVQEAIASYDLAINVELPALKSLLHEHRKLLRPVYDQFDHSQWREGFEEACQVVEVQSRAYLKKGIASGRIVLVTGSGKQLTLTEKDIDKMTLGGLKDAFAQIQNQNYSDARISSVLKLINKDRVGVVHHKARPATEVRLRKNVGRHMWRVVDALKELVR